MGFLDMIFEKDEDDKKQAAPVQEQAAPEPEDKVKFSQSVELESGFDGTPTDEDIARVSEHTERSMTATCAAFMSTLNSLSGVIADEKQRFAAAFAATFKEGKITKEGLVMELKDVAASIDDAIGLYAPEWQDFADNIIAVHVESAQSSADAIERKSARIADIKEEMAQLKREIADHENAKIDAEAEVAKAQAVLRGKQESAQAAVDESKQGIEALAGKVESFIE